MRPSDDQLVEDFMDLAKMMAEPLDPELEACLCQTRLGTALKHPLVFMVIGIVPGMANRMLAQKKQFLAEAEAAENWRQCVFLHERPHRTEALIKYVVGVNEFGFPMPLSECEPWQREIAADVWTDSENLEQFEQEWRFMLEGDGLLLCDDLDAFEDLPETLTIYRGDCPDGGWSWSLDENIARWFAQRFVSEGQANYPLVSGVIKKSDVKGYLTDRGESEILVAPGLVQQLRRVA